jgi:hypothetical protein
LRIKRAFGIQALGQKKIHPEGLVSFGLDLSDGTPKLVDCEATSTEHPESTGFRNRNNQFHGRAGIFAY